MDSEHQDFDDGETVATTEQTQESNLPYTINETNISGSQISDIRVEHSETTVISAQTADVNPTQANVTAVNAVLEAEVADISAHVVQQICNQDFSVGESHIDDVHMQCAGNAVVEAQTANIASDISHVTTDHVTLKSSEANVSANVLEQTVNQDISISQSQIQDFQIQQSNIAAVEAISANVKSDMIFIDRTEKVGSKRGHVRVNIAEKVESKKVKVEKVEHIITEHVNVLPSTDTHTKEEISNFIEDFRNEVRKRSEKETVCYVASNFKDENIVEPNREFTPQLNQVKFYKGEWEIRQHRAGTEYEEYRRENTFTTGQERDRGKTVSKEEFSCLRDKRKKAIIGQAGSGKTTLMKRLARDVMNGEICIHAQDAGGNQVLRNTVHFLNVRDIPSSDKIRPCDLLFRKLIPSMDKSSLKYGFQWLIDNQERVILFLDGLDQASWSLAEGKHNKMDYHDEESTETIMHNIFIGHLFPRVHIILSSREHAIAHLTNDLRPEIIAALAGFSQEDRRQLFIQLAGENGETLWNLLCNQSPSLQPLCSIPLFNVFTVIVYKAFPDNPPDTMTGILIKILHIFMRCENNKKKEEIVDIINKLKKLAYNGTKERRVLFKIKELKDCALRPESVEDLVVLAPGFSIFSQSLMERDYNLFFCHQSIQEMLTSFFIAEMDLADFEKFVREEGKEEHWSVVFRFLCGLLLNKNTHEDASQDLVTVNEYEKKQAILKKYLKYSARRAARRKLELFACLYETDDSELIHSIAQLDVKFNSQHFTPIDMWALSSVMRRCGRINRLHFYQCQLNPDIVDVLRSGLLSKVKIGRLEILMNDKLGVDGLAAVGDIAKEGSVSELGVGSCGVTLDGLKRLREKLEGSKIKQLDFTNNSSMKDDGFGELGLIVRESQVEELVTRGCAITAKGLELFGENLKEYQISKLDIGWNNLSPGAMSFLGAIVKLNRITELRIDRCRISAEGLGKFKASVNGSKISKLDITANEITTDGLSHVEAIAKHCQIEELIMKDCGISAQGLKMLKETLSARQIQISC